MLKMILLFSVLVLNFTPAHAEEKRQGKSLQTSSKQSPVFAMTNKIRKEQGLQDLKFDSQCQKAAQAHAEDMAERNFYDHKNPEGKGLAQRYGKPWLMVGENIVMGRELSAAKAVASWMKSPGHRKNIVSPHFTHLGVGVAVHGSQVYYVQCFVKPAQLMGENPLMMNLVPQQ